MKIAVLIPPTKVTKNVARDLIYGCWCKGKRIAGIQFPPLSLLLVATVLKEAGFDASLVDAAALQLSLDQLKEQIKEYKMVIILTSTMTVNEDAAVLHELKKANPQLITVVFGAHPTFMPKHTLAKPGIDIVVRREAEYIIRDLAKAISRNDDSWKNVKGIGYRENGEVKLNELYPFIENLDELPIPDRTLLPQNVDYFNPVVKRVPYTTMMTSRGCPGKCTFCSSPPFYGRKIRYRSVESMIAELEEIKKLGYKEVFFRDEIFTVSKKRTIELCEEMIRRKLNLSWICSARIGSVDKEMMILMKKAGCHMIRFGVESGSQKILDNIKKGITLEQTRQTFKWAHEVGLDTHAHLMIGTPGETKETINQTIQFVKEIDPTIITCGICTPYPGTALFELVREKHPEVGDGSQCDLTKLHTKSFYNQVFTDLSPEELANGVRRVYRSFYLRPTYLIRWLFRIKSIDEFRRVTLAGTTVFDFIFRGD
jgi:radical SAM superfamily enzyme YgiQ (UPF0313 family)